jgi:intein/homing endonuclease
MQGIGMWRGWQNGFNWDQFGSSILTGAYGGAANYAAMRSALKSCFAAGTPLRTPWGSVKIEDVRVGDLVLSRDENNPDGVVVAQEVEEVFVRQGLITHLHLPNGVVIRTTAEHPFYVAGRGWVPCNQLKVGDLLLCEDGTWVPVEDLFDTGEWETVYNVRVKEFHTYFVGNEEWGFSVWAHNQYGKPLTSAERDTLTAIYVQLKSEVGTTQARKILRDMPHPSEPDKKIGPGAVRGIYEAVDGTRPTASGTDRRPQMTPEQAKTWAEEWADVQNRRAHDPTLEDPDWFLKLSSDQRDNIRELARNRDLLDATAVTLHANSPTNQPGLDYNLIRIRASEARRATGIDDWQVGKIAKIGETTDFVLNDANKPIVKRYSGPELDEMGVVVVVMNNGPQLQMRASQRARLIDYYSHYSAYPEFNVAANRHGRLV